MDLSLQSEQLKCYSCVLDTILRREETQEEIVPDAYPDISSLVSASGMVFMQSCHIAETGLELEGKMNITVLYETERNGDLQALEFTVPYHHTADAAGADESCSLHATVHLQKLDAKILNPRKILVRGEIVSSIQAYHEETYRYSVAVEPPCESICTKKETMNLGIVSQVTAKQFPFEQTITLNPGTTPDRLIGWEAIPYCNETKLVGSKIVFQGGIKTKFRFLTTDGRLSSDEYDLPLSQVLDSGSAGDHAFACVHLNTADGDGYLDGRDHIQLKLELIAWGIIYDEQPIETVTDAYSVKECANCTVEQIPSLVLSAKDIRTIPFRQPLDALIPASDVVDQTIQITDFSAGNTNGEYQCRLLIRISLRSADGHLSQVEQSCMVPIQLPDPGEDQTRIDCYLTEAMCVLSAGGIEVRGGIHIDYVFLRKSVLPTLSALTLDDLPDAEEPRPSAVLRKLNSGETLWDLGKTYASTTEDILAVNQISDIRDADQRFLLIPRKR